MASARRNVARLEGVVDVTGFQQSVPGVLTLPEEGHVRQQVVALRELIKMLDAELNIEVRGHTLKSVSRAS
jgi:hypothetical protein